MAHRVQAPCSGGDVVIDWAVAFGSMFAMDFVFAAYTMYVQQHRPVAAGLAAALIMLFSSLAVMSYMHEALLIVPVMAGAFCGTAAYVTYAKAR